MDDETDKDLLLRSQIIVSLFPPPHQVPFGVDPKTVLCVNFKNGRCDRGNRCKFAHDLEIGRKVAKKDLYTDSRDENKENGRSAGESGRIISTNKMREG